MKVDGLLGVEPKLGRDPKRGAQLQGHLGGHGAAAIDDAVDDLDIATEVICQLLLSHAKGNQEFLAKDLARGGGLSAPSQLSHHGPSVVVAEVDLGGTGIRPAEDDSPLKSAVRAPPTWKEPVGAGGKA